jgi:hypothetical protein
MRDNSGARIDWEVNTPEEVRHFDIQRSTDGSNFQTIGQVIADAVSRHYSFVDNSATANSSVVYYRIRETDRQGREYYSSIVKLSSVEKDGIDVYPNPAGNTITIAGTVATDDKLSALLYDMEGRLVKKEEWQQARGTYSKTIAIDHLPGGMYWLQVAGNAYDKKVKIFKR